MPHLTLGFYLLALLAGSASLAQTFLIWQRYRKAVIRRYGLFLLSLFLLLLGFTLVLYARIVGWEGTAAARDVTWILFAAGGLTFIFCAAPFYHSLLGLPFRGWVRVLFFALDVLAALAALTDLVAPRLRFTGIALNALLFGLILYGLVLIAVNLRSVGERALRRALTLFFALTLAFFPLMYIDAAMAYLPALTIAFGLRYLNRPAYSERERLTEHFVSAFKVTAREQEIIRLLLGVKNRVQLFRLIRANALE